MDSFSFVLFWAPREDGRLYGGRADLHWGPKKQQNLTMISEKFIKNDKALAKILIDNGIGIIRHRSIVNTRCPGDFPIEQLGEVSELNLIKLRTILSFIKSPEPQELPKDIFGTPKELKEKFSKKERRKRAKKSFCILESAIS